MELAQYFRDKIERRAQFYETQAKLIDAAYLVQVERLAERSDEVYARFYRETMAPRYIWSATAHIRSLLDSGKIVEADRKLQQLANTIQHVDRLLTHPYFNAGLKVVEGGRKAAAQRYGTVNQQAIKSRKIRDAFNESRANGKSKTEAQKVVAKTFGLSTRTIRNYLHKKN